MKPNEAEVQLTASLEKLKLEKKFKVKSVPSSLSFHQKKSLLVSLILGLTDSKYLLQHH